MGTAGRKECERRNEISVLIRVYHRFMRRGCAAVLVALMTLLSGIPADCAGWQLTAQGRMDCCARANHDCPDQSIADDCCSRSEERQQEQSAGQLFVLLSPSPLPVLFAPTPVAAPMSESSIFWFESRIDGRPQRPAYLLASVLLI